MIRLRSFRKDDLARLYELDQSCFAPGIAYSIADLRYFLAASPSLCWVAESDRDGSDCIIAGFIIVERLRRGGAPTAHGIGIGTGHVITIDVDPRMRRQGVGSLLLRAAEERLVQEGVAKLTLEAAENNAAALAFYRRFGFIAAGRIPNYYAGGLAAQVMEKALSSGAVVRDSD